MAQMTPEVSRLLKQALSLSVEEQEALADSLISNLDGKVDEGVQAAWEVEIGKRIAELDSGKAKTASWAEVRKRNLAKLPSPLIFWNFMRMPEQNTIRHSSGTWNAASMLRSDSTQK
jgi:putative addiction module component (TIGR02574 family)